MTDREVRPFAITILIYLVPCLIGLFLVFSPTLLSGFRLMQTDPGDTRHLNYLLEHSYQWLTGNSLHSSFWNPPFFWPVPNVAAWSETLLGVAPAYWLMRIFGFMPDTSFQLWMILMAALNYFAALFFFRNFLQISVIGSLGGAYFFAFAGVRIAQLSHQHLLAEFYALAAIIFLVNAFRGWQRGAGRRRISSWLLGFAVAMTLQIYSGVYVGWFLCFGLGIFIFVSCFQESTRCLVMEFVKFNWLAIVGSVLLAAIILSPMAYHYFLAYRELGPRGWSEVVLMIPQMKSWLYFGESPIYSWLGTYVDFRSLDPLRHEHVLGLGFVTILACSYGYFRYAGKDRWLRVLAISGLIVFLLALMYPYGLSPWKLVWAAVPGASVIRAVSRIVLLLLIPISIGLALGLQGIRSRAVAIAVLALVCLEQWHSANSYDKLEIRRDVEKIAASLSSDSAPFYYAKIIRGASASELAWGPYKYHLDAMWAGLISGHPTLNGYTSSLPKQWALWDKVCVTSQVQAIRVEEAVRQWAHLSNLRVEDISCPWLKQLESLPAFCPPLDLQPDGCLSLDFGSEITRRCFVSGWHSDEPGGAGAGATGRRASMLVPLTRNVSYSVELTVEPMAVPGRTQEIEILCNDTTIAEFDLAPGIKMYRFPLQGEIVKNLNRIEFKFAYLDRPFRLAINEDNRQLSVAFHKLEFLKTDKSSLSVSKASEAQTADLRGQPAPAGWNGFSAPEPWGTWTDGTEATLIFRLNGPVASDLQLIIEGKALVNDKHHQRLGVRANGKTLAQMTLSPQSPSPDPVIIPRSLVDETGVLKVTLLTPDAVAPKELGINQDARRLALSIVSVAIKPVEKEGEERH